MTDIALLILSLAITAFLVIFVALLVKASMIVIIHLFSNSDDHHRNVYNGLK